MSAEIITIIIISIVCFILAAIGILAVYAKHKLQEFRRNLKTGDVCYCNNTKGSIATIIGNSVIFVEEKTKKFYPTYKQNIYIH